MAEPYPPEIQALIHAAKRLYDAARANGIYHTPVARRKFGTDVYTNDAEARTREAIAAYESLSPRFQYSAPWALGEEAPQCAKPARGGKDAP